MPGRSDAYLLACQRYIELNPVRAGMVMHPADYPWSSYRANAEGEASPLIQAHGLYSALGQDAEQRQAAYRALFRHELEPGLVDQIRRATNGNFVLGDERFAREIEAVVGRRAVPGKSGRPRKCAEPPSGALLDG